MSTISESTTLLEQVKQPAKTISSAEVESTTPMDAPAAQALVRPIYRYRYLGNYPKDRNTGWSVNMQGVTHDENHWYFTQEQKLWKFPVGHDLNQKVTRADPARGILQVNMPEEMRSLGYNHFGDFDCAIPAVPYRPKKRFLMIATEGKKDGRRIDFEFHPGSTTAEEPEGLTYWNLDDGRAPHIRGCLHAIMNDQNWPDDDTLYFKHYEADDGF